MSTTPETSPTQTSPPQPAPLPAGPVAETAPSATVVEGPAFARAVGFIGLFLLVLGAVVIITTRAVGPRWVPESWGFIFGAAGLAAMLYHAFTDGEEEVRRMYAGFALFWLLFALGASLIPGPVIDRSATTREVGYNLLPWGVGAALVSLVFAMPFIRHETDETYRNGASTLLLAVGGLLCVGSVAAGVVRPDFLTGPGLCLALLGLAFLCAYLGTVDTSDGIGYTTAFALGAFGAAVLLFAIGRAAFPTLLYEGPGVLRQANGSLDPWKVAFRVLGGVAFLIPAALAFAARGPLWLKAATGLVGLAGAGVVGVSLFANPVHSPPRPFLVPTGLILAAIGLVYLAVSLGVCSDNQFVTLTRRELSAYFFSPIGYLVLGGMILVEWYGYRQFCNLLLRLTRRDGSVEEPIVQYYFFALIPVLAVILQVPAITMRLLSEERRTGSLEVLLTAPVSETPVVLSKFLATWIFFLVCWVPAGLFLIALRLETGQEFDYRPLLSFYAALAACGAAFVAIGLFFSALSSNQIVAAVLTFAVMLGLMMCFFIKQETTGFGTTARQFLARLSYIDLWMESLEGQLPLRDVLVWLSAAVFGLFLTVKVLEARKWN